VGVIAVIDLGELPTGRVLDDDSPARPRRRWPIAALVLATALSTITAAGPVPRPLPAAVVNVPGNVQVVVSGDRLFLVQPFPLAQGRDLRYVSAHHLLDLAELWRVELPLGGGVFTVTTEDGVLALTGMRTLPTSNGGPAAGPGDNAVDSVGLDMSTGALIWRRSGFIEGQTVTGRVILSTDFGLSGPGPEGEGWTLRAVSRSGRVVWSYAPPPGGARRLYRYDRDWVRQLVVVLPDGRVELRDVDTGQLVRSRRVDPPLREMAGRYIEVVGDLLLAQVGSEVLAYGLDRLDLRWRLPVQTGRDGWFTACGRAVCLAHHGGGLKVLDAGTGRVRWSDPRWTWGFAVGHWLMVTDAEPGAGDLETVAVVDPESGRVERNLGRWQPVDVVGGSVVALRFDRGRVLVARVDPARGARVVGVVRDIAGSCQVRLPSLWCRRIDNTLGVWRLPD
jgi:outer membrane protein assembly factor BamB